MPDHHSYLLNFFQAHGFAVNAVLKDNFLHRDGGTHDVVLLRHPVSAGGGGKGPSRQARDEPGAPRVPLKGDSFPIKTYGFS